MDENAVRMLYVALLDAWNTRSAESFAALFTVQGNVIGFDGSTMNGREEIQDTLLAIFTDHETAPYIGKVRAVRFVTPEVALLRAVAGMVMAGQSEINPQVNTIQTLVAVQHEGEWRIELFQNTPAQFHGRPELVRQMTEELQELL